MHVKSDGKILGPFVLDDLEEELDKPENTVQPKKEQSQDDEKKS